MLIFLFWLEMGMLPQGDFQVAESMPTITAWEAGYTDIGAELRWRGFGIGGGVKTAVMIGGERGGFKPFSALYDACVSWERGGFEVGFRHYCYHPVLYIIPAARQGAGFMASYEELYVRYEYGGAG